VKLALFAFEPFGPWEVNSTDEVTAGVAEQLRDEGHDVVRTVLPVVLRRAPGLLTDVLEATKPDAVLATGLAGLRPNIDVERVAINVADFRISDNEGVRAVGLAVDPTGPDAWLAAVDVRALRDRIAETGARARVSETAGTYLCNAIHYTLLSWSRPRGVPGMFLHIPPLPAAARTVALRFPASVDPEAGMPLATQVAGVTEAARFLLELAEAAKP
jgi:pyroglutamyl-peptidase